MGGVVAHSTRKYLKEASAISEIVKTKAGLKGSKSGQSTHKHDRFIIFHSTRPIQTLPRGRTSLHAVYGRHSTISRRCHSPVCLQSSEGRRRITKTKSPPAASFVLASWTSQRRTSNSPPPKPGGANTTCTISTLRSTQMSSNPRSASTRVGRGGGTR
jgi:hypothetical protein